MKMKKLLALALCLMMALSAFSFSAAEEAVPNLAGQYFSYGYDVGFWIDYFFHFYDEVPGFGKVFYAGFAANQIVFTGTYEILPEARDYACWPDRATVEAAEEGAAAPTGNAPYTIVFYDFDGNELDRCALDETHLYNDMKNLTGIGGGDVAYALDTEPETSSFAASYQAEQAVSILSLVSPEDDTATLDLRVNGKYDDLVLFFIEGTYAMNEDQSVITLTPSSEGDEGATVTKNDDGTYTYLSNDGTEVILAAASSVEIAYAFKGAIPVPGMEGMNADLILNLLSDNTLELYADFMGNRMDIDAGTYDIDMATYSFNLHFEKAGDVSSWSDETGMHVDYARTGDEIFGDISQTLTFGAE